MRWPDRENLPIEVWAAFGANPNDDPGTWSWTDLTDRLVSEPIQLRSGASDGAGEVSASTGTVVLDNDDGALTPLHPASVYWPHVDLGVPIWISLRRAEDTFGRTTTGGWGEADSGETWSWAGGSSADYSVSGGAGGHQHAVVHTIRRTALDGVSLLDCEQVVDIASSAAITGAALVTGVIARLTPDGYYWCRAEFNTDNTITVKISRARGGVTTELDMPVVVPGLTYTPGVPVRMRARVSADRISVRVWDPAGDEPAGWHLDVTDWGPLTEPGGVGCQSWLVLGNTNTLPVTPTFSNYMVRVDLLCGFADSWQPDYLPTADGAARSVVRLTASGILRRLSQGTGTIRSPLRTTIPADFTYTPIAYWPFEDGTNSTQVASGLPGGTPCRAVDVFYAEDDTLPGSAPVLKLSSSGRVQAPVSMGNTGAWSVTFFFRLPILPTAEAPLITIDTTTYVWQVKALPDSYLWEVLLPQDSGPVVVDSANFLFGDGAEPDQWIMMQVDAYQSGGSVVWESLWFSLRPAVGYTTGPRNFVGSVGRVRRLETTGQLDAAQMSIAHWYVLDQAPGFINGNVFAAAYGWLYEQANNRINRVCSENGVRVYIPFTISETLGVQPLGNLLEILRDAERADMGVLNEHEWGLAYLPRANRYNNSPALVVDLSSYEHTSDVQASQVLAPVYDDQRIRNQWTVSRINGSAATRKDEESIDRVGLYDDSVEINVADDRPLPHHAQWRVHLGVWQEMRYPSIVIDLSANPELLDQWLNLRIGSRVQQVNPPTNHPPGPVDQIVLGFDQVISPEKRTWIGRAMGIPAGPWDAGIVEDPTWGRADTDGSELAADFQAGTDTTMSVAVTDGPLWITTLSHGGMFPVYIRTGGVILEVTGITGVSSPQLFTVTQTPVNGVVKTIPAGTPVRLAYPFRLAL